MHTLLKLAVLAMPLFSQDKAPEPAAKDQDDARKRIRELFKEDYAKKAPTDVRTLAQKLLKQGQENKADLPLSFALLREAKEKAIEALDIVLAIEAVDVASQTFAIPSIAQKADALDRIQRKTVAPEALEALLGAYLATVDAAIKEDRYDESMKLFPGAEAVGQRLGPSSAADVKQRKLKVDGISRDYSAIKKAVDTLAQNPDDAEANLAVGRFRCFVRNDFATGIPLLAKSSNAVLRGLAEGELGKLQDAVSFADIGNRWYELAKSYESGKYARRFQERAFFWYDRAWPLLSGIARVGFDKEQNEREERFGKVNLLRLIDPEQDSKPLREAVKAAYVWKLEGGILDAPSLAGMAMIEIPYTMPADYELELILEFVGNFGSDLFYVYPPSSEGRCVGFQGSATGTHRFADRDRALDLPGAGEKGQLTSQLPLFQGGKQAHLLFISKGGSLTVIADGRTFLASPGKFSPAKGKNTLSLGCYSAKYRIHSLKVSPAGKRLR